MLEDGAGLIEKGGTAAYNGKSAGATPLLPAGSLCLIHRNAHFCKPLQRFHFPVVSLLHSVISEACRDLCVCTRVRAEERV